MHNAVSIGRYVGRKDVDYDFEREGERIKGTRRTAYFVGEGLQVSEFNVRKEQADLLDSLKANAAYTVTATPYARNNRVEWVLADAVPAQ